MKDTVKSLRAELEGAGRSFGELVSKYNDLQARFEREANSKVRQQLAAERDKDRLVTDRVRVALKRTAALLLEATSYSGGYSDDSNVAQIVTEAMLALEPSTLDMVGGMDDEDMVGGMDDEDGGDDDDE